MKEARGVIQPAASDDEDAPILLNPEYPHFRAIFEISDVILHVLDARDPLSFRSWHIKSLVSEKPGQRLVFVLNKTGTCFPNPAKAAGRLKRLDTCARESVCAWAAHLRASQTTLIFSATGDGPKAPQDALGATTSLELLSEWAEQKDEDLVVAVISTTNVSPCLSWLYITE